MSQYTVISKLFVEQLNYGPEEEGMYFSVVQSGRQQFKMSSLMPKTTDLFVAQKNIKITVELLNYLIL